MKRVICLVACVAWVSIMAARPVPGTDTPQANATGEPAQIVLGGKKSEAAKDKEKDKGAEKTAAASDAKAPSQPALRTTTQKRQWLRQQIANGVADKREVKQLQARIDRLTPQQVDAMTNAILAQQLPQDQQQQILQEAEQELQRAQAMRQMLADEYWLRNFGGAVGYMPMITWLPQGTSFGASGVISPDGRYVRVSPSPFFSSVGPVYTYNINTGETRPWPPQSTYPYYGGYPRNYPSGGYGQINQNPPTPSAYPKVWHDGMRTRVGQ